MIELRNDELRLVIAEAARRIADSAATIDASELAGIVCRLSELAAELRAKNPTLQLSEVGLRLRTVAWFSDKCVHTVLEAREYAYENRLLMMPNFGRLSLNELFECGVLTADEYLRQGGEAHRAGRAA